jgi:hypothetical protein
MTLYLSSVQEVEYARSVRSEVGDDGRTRRRSLPKSRANALLRLEISPSDGYWRGVLSR